MENTIQSYIMDPKGRDVYGEVAQLRQRGDVTRVELNGVPAWAVTSYAIQKKMFSDPCVSRDPRKHWPAWIDGKIPREWPLFTWLDAQNMFTAHGSEHRRLRGIVSKTLTPRRVEALRPSIEEITFDCLNKLTSQRGKIVDLCPEYTQEIPIRVFCELMGITEAGMRERMCRCVRGLFHTAATPEEVVRTHAEIHTIIKELISAKGQKPGDDLTSALIVARTEEGGSQLSEDELIGTILVLMMGGYETTAHLFGNAIVTILSRPDQMELLRNSVITWHDVIEETLRYEPSVANLPLRFAAEDIELGGVTIPKGDAIIVGLAAAGRDPAFFGADAEQFDATRPNKRHLAFGHGVHVCLGALLARVEAEIAFSHLFDRFPQIELAEPTQNLEPVESWIMNGFRALPVRLS
ncbi:cytochrome P450 [Phyllobacterium salinisoli]|uniref:Cytochrome P450 n=1 Tax=Phyllobacterium salinisoli TaxID=1899321 RepID=A0A368K2S3_9HYPH|nr:cytochrome P450 [Phyllobacterium salinisoli]RCS22280.1 cytochrome P450 [Phyllobacterium salinisoli]